MVFQQLFETVHRSNVVCDQNATCLCTLKVLKEALAGIACFQNRKNDEASYEKMLKLRRDLNRAL